LAAAKRSVSCKTDRPHPGIRLAAKLHLIAWAFEKHHELEGHLHRIASQILFDAGVHGLAAGLANPKALPDYSCYPPTYY
jgi:hypothetical protein